MTSSGRSRHRSCRPADDDVGPTPVGGTTNANAFSADHEETGDTKSLARSCLIAGLSKALRAGMVDVCSNLSTDGLTPDGLRALVAMKGPGRAERPVPTPRAHQLKQRLGREVVADMVQRYQAGESATLLAEENQVAPSAVLRLLRGQGVTVRKHGLSPAQDALLANAYSDGATMAEIGERYGLSHATVRRALLRAGTVLRPTGRPPAR